MFKYLTCLANSKANEYMVLCKTHKVNANLKKNIIMSENIGSDTNQFYD